MSRLDAIRADLKADGGMAVTQRTLAARWLLGEVERLTTEAERLRKLKSSDDGAYEHVVEMYHAAASDLERVRAEARHVAECHYNYVATLDTRIEALTAENERLRVGDSILRKMAAGDAIEVLDDCAFIDNYNAHEGLARPIVWDKRELAYLAAAVASTRETQT